LGERELVLEVGTYDLFRKKKEEESRKSFFPSFLKNLMCEVGGDWVGILFGF